MRIQIQNQYGVCVSKDFGTDVSKKDLEKMLEVVASGKTSFFSFGTDEGATMYFPEEILKNSIISLVGGGE